MVKRKRRRRTYLPPFPEYFSEFLPKRFPFAEPLQAFIHLLSVIPQVGQILSIHIVTFGAAVTCHTSRAAVERPADLPAIGEALQVDLMSERHDILELPGMRGLLRPFWGAVHVHGLSLREPFFLVRAVLGEEDGDIFLE